MQKINLKPFSKDPQWWDSRIHTPPTSSRWMHCVKLWDKRVPSIKLGFGVFVPKDGYRIGDESGYRTGEWEELYGIDGCRLKTDDYIVLEWLQLPIEPPRPYALQVLGK